MTLEDQRRLIGLLTKTHTTTRQILAGADLDLRVYQDSGWRIRDIIGHLATWDRQVAKSLQAFREGEEYAIPDHDETAFNAQEVLRQQDWTNQQIFEEWEQARDDFKEAVEDIPLEQYPGDVLYPWGDERGSIAYLVEVMVEHDIQHQGEIVKAIESSLGD